MSYGRLTYRPPTKPLPGERPADRRGQWVISAQPQVMVVARRLFLAADSKHHGYLALADTLDVAKDLDWFTSRYPLDADSATRARLLGQVASFEGRQTAVTEILAGKRRDHTGMTPARTPRPYQAVAAQLAVATCRQLLTDDVGLGKTMSAILVLAAPDALPAMFVCQAHLPAQIAGEIAKTFPDLRTHVITTTQPYDLRDKTGHEPDVIIGTYTKLAGWQDHLRGRARTIVFDECQELRHSKTQKYDAAASIADGATYALGLSNTPVYGLGIEAFHIISVLAPDLLGTREEFVREWCSNDPKTGKLIVTEPAAFGAYLRDQGFMLGRTWDDVGLVRPRAVPVVQPVDCDTTVIEKSLGSAAEIARIILSEHASKEQRFTAGGRLQMKMRQVTGIAKAPFVAAFVDLLLQTEQKVVLCGWHRACYDIWLGALARHNPVLYTGSETPAAKARSVRRFMTGDSRVLILSLRSGTGLDGLQAHCRNVVFGELDWSPAVHRQAIGRLARGAGLDHIVNAFYLVSTGGTDPIMEELLQLKRQQAEPMLTADGELIPQAPPDRELVRMLARQVLADVGEPFPGDDVPVPDLYAMVAGS